MPHTRNHRAVHVTLAPETLQELDRRIGQRSGRKSTRSSELARAVHDPAVRAAADLIRRAAEELKRRSASAQATELIDQILQASWDLSARHGRR